MLLSLWNSSPKHVTPVSEKNIRQILIAGHATKFLRRIPIIIKIIKHMESMVSATAKNSLRHDKEM